MLADDRGAQPLQAGDVHVQAAGADRVAAGQRDPGAAAAGDQRAEHADRGAHPPHQVVVGLGRGVLRHVDDAPGRRRRCRRCARRSTVAAQPPQHLAHDRRRRGCPGPPRCVVRPGGQQGGGHQLERAVLRAGDPHPAGQGRAAGHLEALHRVTLRRRTPDRWAAAPRLAAMVRLTRIYTKTGDAGQTHLGDMSRVAKTDPRLVAYADVDETNSVLGVALALGRPASRRSPSCCAASRTTCSTSAPTSARRSRPTRSSRRCGSPPAYTERLEAACDEYNEALPKLTSFILPGRHRGRRAAAPGAGRRPAGRAQRLGPAGRRRRAHQRRDRALPQPAVGPAVHPGPGRQPRRRHPLGARRAQRRPRPARLAADAGGQRSARRGRLHPGEEAGHRRAVHRQLPRCPPGSRWSGRRRPTGSARSSRPGGARTRPGARRG